jgi:hypothetical protein
MEQENPFSIFAFQNFFKVFKRPILTSFVICTFVLRFRISTPKMEKPLGVLGFT